MVITKPVQGSHLSVHVDVVMCTSYWCDRWNSHKRKKRWILTVFNHWKWIVGNTAINIVVIFSISYNFEVLIEVIKSNSTFILQYAPQMWYLHVSFSRHILKYKLEMLYNKTNRRTNFPNLFWLKMNLYLFRAVHLPIIRGSLTVHLALVYVIWFEVSLGAGPARPCS
jgi:hypothetical protein